MADDFSELYELAVDLESAPANIAPELGKSLGIVSGNIKKEAQKSVRRRNSRLAHAAKAISYDLTGVSGPVSEMSSEIGYEKGGEGNLGTWIEFGAPDANNQLSPSHDLGNALLNNEDDFERRVQIAVDEALKKSGL